MYFSLWEEVGFISRFSLLVFWEERRGGWAHLLIVTYTARHAPGQQICS